MPKADAKKQSSAKNNGSALGFEATLWATADKLRGNLDAAEYKHVVLGLIFLKYISDAFEEHHAALQKEKGADPEDRDEYKAVNIFWVPPEARWTWLQGRAKQPTIGKLLDSAMIAIERDNPRLKGVLPKDYARPHLDKQSLGGVIDLVSTIGLGDKESRSKDIIGRVTELGFGPNDVAHIKPRMGRAAYKAPDLLLRVTDNYKAIVNQMLGLQISAYPEWMPCESKCRNTDAALPRAFRNSEAQLQAYWDDIRDEEKGFGIACCFVHHPPQSVNLRLYIPEIILQGPPEPEYEECDNAV